jgi:hypothetical protein
LPPLAIAAVLALAGVASPPAASAQVPAEHIRGKVKVLEGGKLTIATREGKTAIVSLSRDWSLMVMKPVDIAAIKPGSVIGVTEIDRPSGGDECLEVHLAPPGAKMGAGHYPWDLKPGSQMTNGAVARAAQGAHGRELDVDYPGGSRHIIVARGVPVVEMVPGDRAMLHQGQSVFIAPMQTPEGGWAADRVLIGDKGEAPPL